MNKIYFKKLILFSIVFFSFLFLFQANINTASMTADEEYLKEIERIKTLSPNDGYEAYMKLKKNQTLFGSGTGVVKNNDGTISFVPKTSYDDVGKTYNTGKIEDESWIDEKGKEYKNNQKSLFQYFGTDANCAGLDIKEEKICRTKQPFWQQGSFKTSGNLAIGGDRLAFNSVDSSGINWIMSGIYEPIYNVLGFDKNNQNLIFEHDVFIEKNLNMNSDNNNSVFLRGGNSGEKIVQTDNDISIHNNGVDVLKVFDDGIEINNLTYKVKVKSGLEIEDFLKTDNIIFQSGKLLYCNPNLPEDEQTCTTSNRKHDENFIYKYEE